jgi:hypothetical protein
MKKTIEDQSFVKSDAGRGTIFFSVGLLIFFFAIKYLLFGAGLAEKPVPGTLLYKIFDFIFLVR